MKLGFKADGVSEEPVAATEDCFSENTANRRGEV